MNPRLDVRTESQLHETDGCKRRAAELLWRAIRPVDLGAQTHDASPM